MHASLWPLIGVGVLVAGFAARLNPLAAVVAAAYAAGLAGGMGLVGVTAALGKAFLDARYVAAVWLVLPVIGLLERAGLQAQARALVARVRAATAGRVLLGYFVVRQVTAALGLAALGGHAQMVRPLVAPMAEAADGLGSDGEGSPERRRLIRAHAAAADNVAVFFGEDVFVAMSSVLLIRGVLAAGGREVAPLSISAWALPTAAAALVIHGVRLLLLDRRRGRAR